MILKTLFALINIGAVIELFYGLMTRFNTEIETAPEKSDIVTKQNFFLEDDPMCGTTTGGRDECFWNCEIIPTPLPSTFENLITNPECLRETCHQ